ncbi:GtrA family protein [Bacillus sp. ISL-35]|uniref:GtrA family protein n=1 Tax=Bacillus sp. ISL-35 TaxID=2819122 RepID=UPI001BEA7B9F|nr:GtrA family protein [Bacillus sp. ISL-35]MBT2681024.1 GtrA family protein [Bacillus sp. ISL-35]MBT2705343.1 GtrA family protein [Chryseobacterium sp. ISL-80]
MSQSLKQGSYLRTTSQLNKWIRGCFVNSMQFLRFMLVGMLNTMIGMGLMILLKNGLDWPYWHATFTGNTIGAAVSFILNRAFTFKSSVSIREGAPRFILVVLISYILSFSVSHSITERINEITIANIYLSLDTIAIILGSIFYTITNFIGQKLFVFKEGEYCSS